MQRRSGQSSSNTGGSAGGAASPAWKSSSSRASRRNKGSSGGTFNSLWTIVFGGIIITAITSWYLFPKTVISVEEEAIMRGQFLAEKALEAEHRVEDWFHHEQNLPPDPSIGGAAGDGSTPSWNQRTNDEATAAMVAQGGSWVEGEKKLKAKLKELAARQQQGQDLGVPVLTRYLGEDIPAWVSKDMDQQKWQAQVDAKYAEMRKEEEEWQARMQQLVKQRAMQLQNQPGGGVQDIGITTA